MKKATHRSRVLSSSDDEPDAAVAALDELSADSGSEFVGADDGAACSSGDDESMDEEEEQVTELQEHSVALPCR